MNGGDTRHLNRRLDRAGEEETPKARAVGEELNIGLCLMLMLKGQGVLDLIEFGADPRVVDVSVAMEFRQGAETLLDFTVVDEPSFLEVSSE